MNIKITWLHNGFTQIKQLVNCKQNVKKRDNIVTMNSPIYNAIADGSYCIDLGYGKFHFKAEQA